MRKTPGKNKSSDISFFFALKGRLYDEGEMNAEIASSILKNLSLLVYSSDLEVTGRQSVSLKIKATNRGSFEFFLNIYELLQSTAQTKIPETDISVGALLAKSLGIIDNGIGLIDLILKLRGGEAKVIKTNKAEVVIEGDNVNSPITINKNVYNLYINGDVRTALSETFGAVANDRVPASVEIRDPKTKKAIKTISNEELQYFAFEPKEEYIEESTILTRVRVVKAVYEGNSQWRVKFEGQSVDVKISDSDWLNKFQTGLIDVPPGSLLKVTLLKKIPIVGEKIVGVPKYEIVEVQAVMLPPKQQKLI